MLLLARAQAANLNSARAETWRGKVALRRGQGVTAEDGEIVLASVGPMVIYYRRATHGFARSARRSFEFGSPLAWSREGARGVASGWAPYAARGDRPQGGRSRRPSGCAMEAAPPPAAPPARPGSDA